MKPKRWLQGWLGRTRPLQIPEVLEMAEEHLRVAAMEGLRCRYLPTRLVVAVSREDYGGLEPFAPELQSEMRQALKRASEEPRYMALSRSLEVQLIEAGDLKPGSPPRFYATFPTGDRRADWNPLAKPRSRRKPPGDPEFLFELVLTAASVEHTGLQSLHVLCLNPVLPTRHLDLGDPEARLIMAPDGQIYDETSGKPWPGPEARIENLATAMPVELDGSVDIPLEPQGSKLCRFQRPGRPEILWAPQGLLLVGRRAELVHWIPTAAPRNLSGRHFALLRAAGPTLRLVDLGSTNGTYLAGRRLRPFERVQIAPPETLDIGVEGAMQIAVRAFSAGSR